MRATAKVFGKQGKCLYKPLQQREAGMMPASRCACWGKLPKPLNTYSKLYGSAPFRCLTQDDYRSSCSFLTVPGLKVFLGRDQNIGGGVQSQELGGPLLCQMVGNNEHCFLAKP